MGTIEDTTVYPSITTQQNGPHGSEIVSGSAI